MAFLGTPVVTMVGDRKCTIKSNDVNGLQLGPGQSGTIGLSDFTGGAPDITLPAAFKAFVYSYAGNSVALVDGVNVRVALNRNGATDTNLEPGILKAGVGGAFRITIANSNTGANTQGMEITIEFEGAGQAAAPALVA